MTTINITTEIRKEIQSSILEFDRLIQKELSFSSDLRKHDKVELYSKEIIRLQNCLESGVL